MDKESARKHWLDMTSLEKIATVCHRPAMFTGTSSFDTVIL